MEPRGLHHLRQPGAERVGGLGYFHQGGPVQRIAVWPLATNGSVEHESVDGVSWWEDSGEMGRNNRPGGVAHRHDGPRVRPRQAASLGDARQAMDQGLRVLAQAREPRPALGGPAEAAEVGEDHRGRNLEKSGGRPCPGSPHFLVLVGDPAAAAGHRAVVLGALLRPVEVDHQRRVRRVGGSADARRVADPSPARGRVGSVVGDHVALGVAVLRRGARSHREEGRLL
mmetsp:Transcript_62674/g.176715  ORF Transcript_62674/g.176715 Transcript_62674/m.176715 type:complete len:227 (+) Transcript_62674:498-1178(+)